MVKTAEQKVRDRYRADLENGKTPRALTDANRAILEEIRAEVAAGCQYVQAAVSSGRKRIREAGDEQVRRVEQAGQRVMQQIGAQAAAAAAAASSAPAPSAPVHAEKEAEVEQEEDEAEEDKAAELPPVQAYAAPAPSDAAPSDASAPVRAEREAEAEQEEEEDEAAELPHVQAYKAIALLQELAEKVRCERHAAQRERDGLAYHDGFLQAKKAFAAGFCQAALHSFVSNSWLRQCAERAGLSEDYNECLAARDSYGLLGDLWWASSSDMR